MTTPSPVPNPWPGYVVSVVCALIGVGGVFGGIVVSHRTNQPEIVCTTVFERVSAFAAKHPAEVRRELSQHPDGSTLMTDRELRRCGSPEPAVRDGIARSRAQRQR